MQHVDIKEIYESFTEDDVNLHVDIGWVNVTLRPERKK
ncbi:hypothetical protein SAMN05444506_12467 [Pseudomonas syringae]|uniref:Uncharacterized protein n=1 Tax=Pseudomonas avellanae TaxID=46257 RepID=A0A3M5TZJ6_9PSED|nr:hypothetical protein ALP32_200453 [Pseudomonas avellanae]SDZ53342.1 hypothetical protein SAMN05444506_12467 [Pseudomonas syringae]